MVEATANSSIDYQTVLNIILGILTVYLAIRNFMITVKKENQRESQEMTEVRVQLNQVMILLQDLQKDVRSSNADFRILSERVVKIETKLEATVAALEEIKKERENGKS